MDIERCKRCERRFMSSLALQEEVRHVVRIEGPEAGRLLMRERLCDEHAAHEVSR